MTGYLLWGLVPASISAALGTLTWFLYRRCPKDWLGCAKQPQGFLIFLIGATAALVGLLGGGGSVILAFEVKACEHQAKTMGLAWDYSLWTPCLVELPDGRWIDVDRIDNNHLTGEVTLKEGDR